MVRVSGKVVVVGVGTYVVGLGGYAYYAMTRPASAPSCGCACSVSQRERLNAFRNEAPKYDADVGMDEWITGIGIMRSALLANAKGRVLEVASGTGRNLGFYNPSHVDILVQTDPVEEMLEVSRKKLREGKVTLVSAAEAGKMKSMDARRKAAQGTRSVLQTSRRVRVDLNVADAHALPFPDNSFDTVVDTFGLCSIEDPVKAVQEMQRVCKPEGQILLLEHGRSPYDWLAKLQDKNAEKHAQRWGCYWNKDIGAILQKAELDVKARYDWHFGTTNWIRACPQRPPS